MVPIMFFECRRRLRRPDKGFSGSVDSELQDYAGGHVRFLTRGPPRARVAC